MVIIWLWPHLTQGQTPQNSPNQDSINYYLQIVDQGEKQVGNALAKIGILYYRAGRYNSALSYFDRALPLLNGENMSKEIAEVYQIKGEIFEIFGDNAQPRRYYRLAENQFTRSLEAYTQINHSSGQLDANKNLADISAKRRNFASAVYYQNQVIEGLTKLYQDSLQLQAESFNDLLNKEIESSKDTIFVERPVAGGEGYPNSAIPNWVYILLAVLGLLALMAWWLWMQDHNKLQDLQAQARSHNSDKERLQNKVAELQKMNLALSKMEKQQRHLNLTKDKIFSIISHDLRSPINTISGFLNILGVKLKSIGDIELKALAQEMEESTARLSQFLDDLLKWSMSQMGKLEPQPERIDMRSLVKENFQLVESRLKSKHINFKTDIDENVEVYADVNMIHLVLRNLISNAIKFTRQGGYIAIALASKDDKFAELSVADDGIGIGEEHLQKLFDFEGSNINGLPDSKGAGLGLMLCKEFVELNGGEISVKSTIGEGTCFSVLLPSQAQSKR